ncbi:MAG: VWA domain-containing protein [Terriglobales bacterium]
MKPRVGKGPLPGCVLAGLAVFLWSSVCPATAQQPPAAQTTASTSQPEVSSHDEATTFKVNVHLVVARVVVRDSKGHAVGNLHKEDFDLLDDKKPQIISQFSVERPGNQIARDQKTNQAPATGTGGPVPAKALALPERFVAYVVDDVHMKFDEIARVRDAASRHFVSLRPTDRAAIFTTSGHDSLDFTDDRAKLVAALERIQPHPVEGRSAHPCPYMDYYLADLVVNKQDPEVIEAVTKDVFHCTLRLDANDPLSITPGLQNRFAAFANVAKTAAMHALSVGNTESRLSLDALKDVIRRLSVAPGERSIVLASPGFLTTETEYDVAEVIDRALRANVIIGTLDARGFYAPLAGSDASGQDAVDMGFAPEELQYEIDGLAVTGDVLATLADATAGVAFRNSNDFVEGFRQTATSPEYYYVLGFAPQNMKFDGRFHNLKVKLRNPSGLTLQARKGYYAPKHAPDAAEEAKQEIEDALFSQEEMHGLPIELHTQFFKESEADAKLAVLAHVDVKHLHFRKADGRNNSDLTIASGLFDRNGTFITGTEKVVTMRLRDETLEHRLDAGMTVKTSFDVKPGSYLVRLVVRDSEGQLSTENGAIEIP